MVEYDTMYEYNEEDGGIQFQPYDDELIDEYLIPKLEGKPRGEITTKDVHSKEPWLLDHPVGSFFKKNEWYYFATRTQVSKKKIGCGKKAKRKITRHDDSGFWRANAKINIEDKEKKMIIGEKQTLGFVKSKVDNEKKQKSGDSTSCNVVAIPGSEGSWIMTEYMLPEINGKFRELVICKIHVVENSNNKKDDSHEASTSTNNHHHHIDPSTSAQQPMNMYHYNIDYSTLVQQPNNIVDHGTFLAPSLEQQLVNMYHHHSDPSTSVQQPNTIVNHGTFVAPYSEHQQMNLCHESFQDLSSLEQQPTNIIQKNKKDDHEAYIPHHDHESLADSFTKQQPVNEVHGHVPEVPLIGSEKNDQVFEASRQVSEKDEQVYIDAPIEEEGGEWLQGFKNSLMTMNTSSMPMEEEDVTLIYDTSSFVDQDLLDQYGTLRPQERSKPEESEH